MKGIACELYVPFARVFDGVGEEIEYDLGPENRSQRRDHTILSFSFCAYLLPHLGIDVHRLMSKCVININDKIYPTYISGEYTIIPTCRWRRNDSPIPERSIELLNNEARSFVYCVKRTGWKLIYTSSMTTFGISIIPIRINERPAENWERSRHARVLFLPQHSKRAAES